MAQEVLIYLSLIILVSALLAVLARIMKQPPIIAYLIAGVVVGPLCLNLVGASDSLLQTFARIGVAFLLFIVGLSLDFRLLREIGKISAVVGIIEVALVSFLGTLISIWLGFSLISGIYIGVALAFSSTVVVVKILADKKEIDTLHGRIALGILIVQDIIASLALMLVPLIDNRGDLNLIAQQLGIAIGLIIFVFLSARFLFSRFMNYLARSQETLFIFGIAWALVLATIFYKLGFSMEIGALIAGMSLASSKYALDLEGKMMPLRDFFIILFFVFFGSQLTAINSSLIINAIILSLFVMILKPLIVMITLKICGYTRKTNFLTSMSLAQVSEFSLILIMVGASLGHLNAEIMNLAVLIALITIALSTYVMNHSHAIHIKLEELLRNSKSENIKEEKQNIKKYDVIIFGYHRIGYKILQTIGKITKNFAIVDYNPKVVLSLNKRNIEAIYGDAGNKNFLDEIGLEHAKLVISTVPDEYTNLMISEMLKEVNSSAVFIATAEQPRQALDLYKTGADYVIIPHHLGGDYTSDLIKTLGMNKLKYKEIGKNHRKNLENARKTSDFE